MNSCDWHSIWLYGANGVGLFSLKEDEMISMMHMVQGIIFLGKTTSHLFLKKIDRSTHTVMLRIQKKDKNKKSWRNWCRLYINPKYIPK